MSLGLMCAALLRRLKGRPCVITPSVAMAFDSRGVVLG